MSLHIKVKNLLSPPNFRQINSFVISLVKTLVSRNFCKKSMKVIFYSFHIVFMCEKVNYHKKMIRENTLHYHLSLISRNFKTVKNYLLLWVNVNYNWFDNWHAFSKINSWKHWPLQSFGIGVNSNRQAEGGEEWHHWIKLVFLAT